MRFFSILLVLLLVSILGLLPNDVWACSCDNTISISDAYDQSGFVFFGTVSNIEPSTIFEGRMDTEITTFDVHTIWKGDLNSKNTITIETDAQSSCEVRFQDDNSYYIFTTESILYSLPTVEQCGSSSYSTSVKYGGTRILDFLENNTSVHQLSTPKSDTMLFSLSESNYVIYIIIVLGIISFTIYYKNKLKKKTTSKKKNSS